MSTQSVMFKLFWKGDNSISHEGKVWKILGLNILLNETDQKVYATISDTVQSSQKNALEFSTYETTEFTSMEEEYNSGLISGGIDVAKTMEISARILRNYRDRKGKDRERAIEIPVKISQFPEFVPEKTYEITVTNQDNALYATLSSEGVVQKINNFLLNYDFPKADLLLNSMPDDKEKEDLVRFKADQLKVWDELLQSEEKNKALDLFKSLESMDEYQISIQEFSWKIKLQKWEDRKNSTDDYEAMKAKAKCNKICLILDKITEQKRLAPKVSSLLLRSDPMELSHELNKRLKLEDG